MTYYITSEYTIANILLKKKQKGIENPTTKIEEIIGLYQFIHTEMKGNCILESSTGSLFSAVSMYNKFFQFVDTEDEIIGFVKNLSKKDEEYLLKGFCLPSSVDEVFNRFIKPLEGVD